MKIDEVSPNTLAGSFSDDLVISKIWLIKKLSSLKPSYGTIYVLGSWFGNLALLMVQRDLDFDRIINVDLDRSALSTSRDIIAKLGLEDRIIDVEVDANTLAYSELGEDGLVVNTSCNNMENQGWYQNIPIGTMVALQGRDNDPGAKIKHDGIDDLRSLYPLTEILFEGEISLEDDDGKYRRFMLIGIR